MDQGTLKSYIAGFIMSVALTLAAFFVVVHPAFFRWGNNTNAILVAILALAVAQLVVQMIFFLHLTSQPGRSWKLSVFFSTLALVLIIVIGSIWIMNHLNYSMMASPSEMNQYIQSQQGF